jgi:hypothetical protein
MPQRKDFLTLAPGFVIAAVLARWLFDRPSIRCRHRFLPCAHSHISSALTVYASHALAAQPTMGTGSAMNGHAQCAASIAF